MRLTPLFHWAPAERFDSIRTHGLRLSQQNTVASSPLHYLCLSPGVQHAWSLSGAMEWCSEIDEWDLWLVHTAETDDLRVRADYGTIREIKLYNPVPPDRIWWVGRRDVRSIPA